MRSLRFSLGTEHVRKEWAGILELLDKETQWKAVPEGLIWRDYELTE